jgi:hypothetical protein
MTDGYATQETPDALTMRRRLALAMMGRATDASPVKHWTQGLARALQGGMGGYEMYRADQDERAQTADANDSLVKVWNNVSPQSGNPALQPVQSGPVSQGSGDPASAIASIESGGKYDRLGPVINRGSMVGDRAYGKYQVMGTNVGPWTEKYLGQRLTPQQFVQNPQAQDAVFKGEFGRLSQAYGPEGAARAWFAGEGGMNDPNRRDQLGTSVAAYGQKFAKALGPQVASLGGGMPTNDTPAPAQPAGQQMAQAPTVNRDEIVRMLKNPKSAPTARGIITNDINQRLKPPEYKIEITPDGRAIAVNTKDPTKVQTTTVPGASEAAVKHSATKEAAEKVAVRQATEGLPATSEETTNLRKEVQQLPSYKNVTASAPVYKSMLDAAGRDNRAADVNLIYGMAKIMDPGSVVRESEMTIAQAVATIPQQLQATVLSQLKETGRLSPDVRAAIMAEAHGRMVSYQNMYDQDATMMRGIAERRRMDPRDVLQTFGPFEQFKAPAPAQEAAPFKPAPNWQFSPSRGQYRDPQGNVYDQNGKPVK